MDFVAAGETLERADVQPCGRLPLDRVAAYDRILLLQGPVGPFFDRLARYLIDLGKTVYKINFNAGDAFFFGACRADPYRGTPDRFADWLGSYVKERRVSAIVLFGEWRVYHQAAHALATERRIPVYIFEEGYIRPFYITCERHGVNGNTLLPRDPLFYSALPRLKEPSPDSTKSAFWRMALFACGYYIAGVLGTLALSPLPSPSALQSRAGRVLLAALRLAQAVLRPLRGGGRSTARGPRDA
jgi:capsule polysaccharide modification protein KpsS